jgi:hypothetical protein
MKRVHVAQKVHILNCLQEPEGLNPYTVSDRFGSRILCRGSTRIECLWRIIRKIIPEKLGISFADNLFRTLFLTYNLDRLVQFDSAFDYLCLSPTCVELVNQAHAVEALLGLSSPLPAVKLAEQAATLKFGIDASSSTLALGLPMRRSGSSDRDPILPLTNAMMAEMIEEAVTNTTSWDNAMAAMVHALDGECGSCFQVSSLTSIFMCVR